MSAENNRAVVREFVDVLQNGHDVDAAIEMLSPDFIDRSGMTDPPTREGSRAVFEMLLAAFPGMRATIHDMIAEGDKVATRKTLHASHGGEFFGVPATGKRVAIEVIDIMRVADGKITEHWASVDMLGLMKQLGVVPEGPG